LAAACACGLSPASGRDLAAARRLAAARIGVALSPLANLRALLELCPGAILTFREAGRVDGVLGVLPLTAKGEAALLCGALDFAAPLDPFVAPRFVEASSLYAMGIASRTPEAARAVVSGVVRLREACAAVPFYARPVTEAGRRVLVERLGCAPAKGGELYLSPARPLRTAA
jgi:hypothetical protein